MTGQHASDCAVHSEPAYPAGPCDCHLSIESRLDQMIKHAHQGSTDAAFDIFQELVERYKAMQPAKMQPCAGRNCGSTDPNLHSAECFEDYEKVTGMNRQEPVAWVIGKYLDRKEENLRTCIDKELPLGTPLYTAPPQREWQGLTDEEIFEIWMKSPAETEDRFAFVKAVIAKLREKNNG